ncbi:MAG: hypothetical protein RJQ00_12785 [Vicingaceae bacterium]
MYLIGSKFTCKPLKYKKRAAKQPSLFIEAAFNVHRMDEVNPLSLLASLLNTRKELQSSLHFLLKQHLTKTDGRSQPI